MGDVQMATRWKMCNSSKQCLLIARVLSESGIWPKYCAGFGKTQTLLTGYGIWSLLGKRDSPKSLHEMRHWERKTVFEIEMILFGIRDCREKVSFQTLDNYRRSKSRKIIKRVPIPRFCIPRPPSLKSLNIGDICQRSIFLIDIKSNYKCPVLLQGQFPVLPLQHK